MREGSADINIMTVQCLDPLRRVAFQVWCSEEKTHPHVFYCDVLLDLPNWHLVFKSETRRRMIEAQK